MLFAMSDDKKTIVDPGAVIISSSLSATGENGAKKSRLTKKHVLIAVIALIVTGLVVTGALVGMKIYTDNNLEVVKYTLNANGISQNVSVDNNAVTYHIRKQGLEAWIVQDFDKGIQVTKQLVEGRSSCFVTALNRSIAADVSLIPDTTPDVSGATSDRMLYKIIPDEIVDLSFLGKKASAMCQNVPTYHAVPDCGSMNEFHAHSDNTTGINQRSKRTPAFCTPPTPCTQANCRCVCACCAIVCADYSKSNIVCAWYYNTLLEKWICGFFYSQIYSVTFMNPQTCQYNGQTYAP